jgi:hypothetical protein
MSAKRKFFSRSYALGIAFIVIGATIFSQTKPGITAEPDPVNTYELRLAKLNKRLKFDKVYYQTIGTAVAALGVAITLIAFRRKREDTQP